MQVGLAFGEDGDEIYDDGYDNGYMIMVCGCE
jgi:hypothetical protein